MTNKDKTQYSSRLSLHITPAMNNRLEQMAKLQDEPKAEIVRAALRAYLDDQEDLLGSRKHFTKMFQRRVDYLEQLLSVVLIANLSALQILHERIRKEPVQLQPLLNNMVEVGLRSGDSLQTLISQKLPKTKPPAK